MRQTLWITAVALNLSGMLYACAGQEKPLIKPDPDFANCAARKDQRENECLIEAGTREAFDACIARVRASCVDGGVR